MPGAVSVFFKFNVSNPTLSSRFDPPLLTAWIILLNYPPDSALASCGLFSTEQKQNL